LGFRADCTAWRNWQSTEPVAVPGETGSVWSNQGTLWCNAWWKGDSLVNGLYAHAASLLMAGTDDDPAAPGAAITVALCGSWEHPPPCPLAAHHSGWSRDGNIVSLRTIFATQPSHEAEVRELINRALDSGNIAAPDGTVSRWAVVASGPAKLSGQERGHAERISGT
jgi:hypothetical protein